MAGNDGNGVGTWSPAPATAPDGALLQQLALAWQQQGEAFLDVLSSDISEIDAMTSAATPSGNESGADRAGDPPSASAPSATTAVASASSRALVAAARAAMQQPRGALDAPVAKLDADTLEALVRLFTLLEMRPGWAAGADSPVVPLFRALRTRVQREDQAPGAAVDIDALAAWVKRHSDNRFLPWGSLQDRLRG